ncbi:MAG: hypothetical protein JW846_06840 [Dehalococcoidia bacterium]|nr:hypothetical protein [Dehalococcoidia bacterium]
MNRALPIVCALLILAGSLSCSPQTNEPPEAYIASVSPTETTAGETVTFVGEGTDTDGTIAGYRWRSDLDGVLSQLPTFETDSLSVGVHVIDFMVQDNTGAWSDKVQGSVKVLPGDTSITVIPVFTVSPSTIEAGESATLSWSIPDATSISINEGIGTVSASGSTSVTPDETTTYILTATVGGSTVALNTTVTVGTTVQQTGQTVTLTPEDEMSGYIRSSGVERTIGMYVGDDDSDRGIQGFFTFDISDIPDDATILRVTLDLSAYDLPYGPPFPELGCLRAYVHEYDRLDGEYFTKDATDPIGEWCDLDALDMPMAQTGFRDALLDEVGENRFQFRLQFSDGESDFDGVRDMLHWERDNLPTLTVEYSSDD